MVEVLEVNVDEEIGRYDFIPRFTQAEEKARTMILTPRKRKIEIVGSIGAGKSTFAKWLKRISPTEMKILYELREDPDDIPDPAINGLKEAVEEVLFEEYYPDVHKGTKGVSFKSAYDIQVVYARLRLAQRLLAAERDVAALHDGSVTAGEFVFCEILNKYFGYLSDDQRRRFEDKALLEILKAPPTDLIICLTCPAEYALENIVGRQIAKQNRSSETGGTQVKSVTDLPITLVELVQQQCLIYSMLPKFMTGVEEREVSDNGTPKRYKAPPIVMIDISRIDPIEQNKHLIFVYETMARALELRKAD